MNEHYAYHHRLLRLTAVTVFSILLAACDSSSDSFEPLDNSLSLTREACTAASSYSNTTCQGQCARLTSSNDVNTCLQSCTSDFEERSSLCSAGLHDFADTCAMEACESETEICRTEVASEHTQCLDGCPADDFRCITGCDERRASAEQQCGFLPIPIVRGGVTAPFFEQGKAAHLPSLLDAAEIAVVEAADARARSLRSRAIDLWTGQPKTRVTITQVEHDFSFGVPLDIREFEDDAPKLAFYGDIARKNTSLLVAETSLKWRNVSREEGQVTFDLADAELAWAESLAFDVKAHVLMWGNDPPLASGSGTPEWLRDKFPDELLSAAQKTELRQLMRAHVQRVVSRYRGRIDVWEVTNEMLNPITDWFIVRLGPEIVNDLFHWAREADPGVQLVYNEWINEIFTGLGGPDAIAVRDRVKALLAAGVPVDALGQQGHFAPGLVNVGIDVDLSQRSRVDDYARALDTLAEAGLPIHITEVTFAAPEEPEHRAAQAEAIMRIWWGHPQVEEIIFWNFWNPLGPRSHLNLGIYGDDGNLTRHGEAILSLLNDRWRTDITAETDPDGLVSLRATHGTYQASWETEEGPVHIGFNVPPGDDGLRIVAVQPGEESSL